MQVITPATPALDFIRATFPNQLQLTSKQVACLLGITTASIRTMRCRGVFKIPSTSSGKDHRYDVRDVAAYFDAARTPKPKRGAPTKAERLAKLEGGAA